MPSKVQIIATIGPAMRDPKIIKEMILHEMDAVRINFSWGTEEDHVGYIKNVRGLAQEAGKRIPVIQDLSGPRIQEQIGHKFNDKSEIITSKDEADLKFGIKQAVDYVAMSFVGDGNDVFKLREKMREFGRIIPIIAKIERKIAVENIDDIIKNADAIMIARGDLGNEIPLEQIPFVEKDIIQKCKAAGKPVIVATQMMLSMMQNLEPTRAEVTDVAYAVMNGADAVMLSEESAAGKHPLETVIMMEKGILEAEKHAQNIKINSL
jgi:pyruvate kinase